jgi:hypothetical protein
MSPCGAWGSAPQKKLLSFWGVILFFQIKRQEILAV